MTQGPPLQRFLGDLDLHRGPSALLGLDRGPHNPDTIRSALASRLALIDGHPQGRSAQADEVRLALHVAAAQLADALPQPGIDRPSDTGRPLRPIEPGERVDPRRKTLLAVVAHSGGWNSTAKQRVGAVAHAMGIPLDEALRLITLTAERGGPGVRAAPERRSAIAPEPGASLGTTPLARALLVASVLCALCSFALIVALIWVVSKSGGGTSSTTSAGAMPSQRPGVVVPSPQAVRTGSTPLLLDTDAIVRMLGGDINTVEAFRSPYDAASSGWVELEPGALTDLAFACAQGVVGADVGLATLLGVLIADLQDDADPVRSMFASAVLARIDGFGALGSGTSQAEASDFLKSLPTLRGLDETSPIEAAAGARLVQAARTPELDIARWSAGAKGLAEQIPAVAQIALARVIDDLLRAVGTPKEAEQRLMNGAVGARAWSDADAETLRAWWSSAEIATERLSLLSISLVGHGVMGFDQAIVLNRASSGAERNASRLALVRALGGGENDEASAMFYKAWAEAFARLTSVSGERAGNDQGAGQSAAFALLSASAAMRWSGDEAAALDMLERIESIGEVLSQPVETTDPRPFTSPTRSPDGVWAAEYLSARRSEDDRITLLTELRGATALQGPADADVLARAAIIGGNRAVRRAAQEAARAFADDPLLINGLLESVHAAARQPDVEDLLAYVIRKPLPSSSDRAWRGAVRRALAEQLAVMTLPSGSGAVANAERVMRDAYSARLGAWESGRASSVEVPVDPLAQALDTMSTPSARPGTLLAKSSELWEKWHERASIVPEGGWAPRSLGMIERRRAARRAYGSGSLQRLALSQLALVEVMGYLIASERPEESGSIERMMNDAEDAWRNAPRVFDQLVIAEEAMARLWAVRMGVDIETSASEGAP